MKQSHSGQEDWYTIDNTDEINSPSLIVYPGRVEANIREMIMVAGDAGNLRPHVKTYKMPEIVRLQLKYGIGKFKCSTIAETEMAAEAGAGDILLAYQPVGPNIKRLPELIRKFPESHVSCIADCETVISELSESAVRSGISIPVWLDINTGMNRTGIEPGDRALNLYRMICELPGIKPAGLHIYNGHINEKDLKTRTKLCNEAYSKAEPLISGIEIITGEPVKIVAGGSPTFPIHARRKNVETSPGTTLLWDYGYSSSFADMNFIHAAVLFTRVVSKPSENMICIDLGHKAVGSEMPQPRVKIIGLEDYRITGHSEEHMVIETVDAKKFNAGDHLYALPVHICPTVDRYDTVYVAENNKVTGQWSVRARRRKITI
jgi:D-serine deaminase-like pyridoxal phosphate-dependent protein